MFKQIKYINRLGQHYVNLPGWVEYVQGPCSSEKNSSRRASFTDTEVTGLIILKDS